MNETIFYFMKVMAGSGNLQVLRIARSLRQRVNADISYGTYLALHMAIGFLFLGGGRYIFILLFRTDIYIYNAVLFASSSFD